MIDNKEPFETEHIRMWIQGGIFHSEYPPNLIVTIEIAKQIVLDRIEYTNGVEYPVLVDIRNIKKVEYSAMKFWASEESYKSISRLAVFSNAKISKIIFNFWFHVDNPIKPTKYFTEIGSAYLFLNRMGDN